MSPNFGWDEGDVSTDEGTEGEQDTVEPQTTDANPGKEPEDTGVSPVNIEDYDLPDRVTEHFGNEDWEVFEVVLSSHATLLIDGDDSSHGVVVEGVSSSGKTTLLELLCGLNDQTEHVDKFTPASLLSGHKDDDTGEASGGDDAHSLLEDTRGRTIVATDLGTLLEGDEVSLREKWGHIANAMDGGEFTYYTGTRGGLSVDDIHFNFVGATTPLDARQHKVMGKVGGRVLFVQKKAKTTEDARKQILEGGLEYGEKKERCRSATHDFLTDLWDQHGGPKSVDMPITPKDEQAADALAWLTDVVRHTRSAGEGPGRMMSLLRDLARGHALLYGRVHYGTEDLGVCVRAALGSVPGDYRPALWLLLRNADEDEPVTKDEVEDALDVSTPTAIKRMNRLAELGLVEMTEVPAQGGPTKAIELPEDEAWAEEVNVP